VMGRYALFFPWDVEFGDIFWADNCYYIDVGGWFPGKFDFLVPLSRLKPYDRPDKRPEPRKIVEQCKGKCTQQLKETKN